MRLLLFQTGTTFINSLYERIWFPASISRLPILIKKSSDMPSVNWLKLQTCKKERTKKYSSNLVMSGKKFCTKTQKRREETFLPLFSVSGGPYTILLARPLKCLRLSILVHNLYCHHFGTRKVESAVYPRSKVRQNSSMVEKIWRLFKI